MRDLINLLERRATLGSLNIQMTGENNMVLYYKDKYAIVLHENSYEVFDIYGGPAIYSVTEIEEYINEQQ